MVPTTKCLLVAVLWGSFFFTLSLGFQNPLNIHNEPAIRTTPKTTTTTLYVALEPLGQEDTWQAYLDEETTGLVYYFDTATGESRWEPPTATFPEVRLPRKKQRLADTLRKEYRKTRQEMANVNESGSIEDVVGGFFSSVTSVLEKKNAPKEEDESLEDSQTPTGSFFNNFFSDGGANEETMEYSASPEESIEEEQTVAQKNPFGSLFGGESASVEDKGTIDQAAAKEENKNGLLDSFSTSFFPSADKEKILNVTPKLIQIEIGSHILPHPAKVRWGGEDATFIKGRTFGVFDGVSGAEKLYGVPLYSRTLASEMKKQCGTSSETVQDMTSYLTSAASYADGAATGASTAVVASIGESGFLQALNVGDSCCMVIRDGKVTAKTREISHYWECPYQLSEDSPDQPKDGTKLNVELISGDLVIMGSDGVFDNVNDDQLLDLVTESPTVKPTPLAKKICDLSRKVSLDKTVVTPYSKQAQRRGDEDFRDGLGGKLDDVSCIVVVCK
jgi:protein phosphatase PTC7